jgi:hypothetical protein
MSVSQGVRHVNNGKGSLDLEFGIWDLEFNGERQQQKRRPNRRSATCQSGAGSPHSKLRPDVSGAGRSPFAVCRLSLNSKSQIPNSKSRL